MKRVDIDILDAYFRDRMNDEQQALFKERLGDPQFEKDLREYRELHMGIEYSIFKTAKEKLQSLEKSLPDPLTDQHSSLEDQQHTSSFDRSFLWKMAAAILILAISTIVFFNNQQSASPQELFADYFEPFTNEFVVVQRSDDSGNGLLRSFQAYDNAQYHEAVSGFQSILQEQPDNIMVLFYLSNAQLALQDHEGAITNLQRFLEISEDFKIQAQWYLALAYISNQQISEAKNILNEIQDDSIYGAQALEILEQLNNK